MVRTDEKMILMGRIGAAHGLRGQVRIQSFTADPMALATYGQFATDRPGLIVTVTGSRVQKNMLIATLEGITDRTAAEALNGVQLFIARHRLPLQTEADEFYLADLIGLEARDKTGKALGTVSTFFDHGAGDIVEVTRTDGTKLLLAFTTANVPEISLADGFLVISPPDEIDGEPPKKPART